MKEQMAQLLCEHFEIVMVSASFEGVSKVQSHREVYKTLDGCLKAGVHALALDLKSKNDREQCDEQ